jgi:hypothetical protein
VAADMLGRFDLIGDVLDVRAMLPVEVSPDLRLERPDDEQLERLIELLDRTVPLDNPRRNFENRWTRIQQPGSAVVFNPEQLPRAEWRYLILSSQGNNSAFWFLDAARLVEPALTSIAHIRTSLPFGKGDYRGWSVDSLLLHRSLFGSERYPCNPAVLDDAAVTRMRAAYHAFIALDRAKWPGVHRAVELFSLFMRLPLANFLDVLAMFMLIEMLLTHNPGDREIGDSLSHQITEKVPFVFTRMPENLDYSCFAPDAKPETIWKKLYKYRSYVAHGEQPNFSDDLQVLKDAATADRFLTTVTRRLLRHALDDPGLFEGLKPI